MGRKSRIKYFRRELKQMGRKIQIVAEEHIPDGDQDQIADLEQIDENAEIDEILKRLMPVLPSFSGFTKEQCDVEHLGEVPDKFDEEEDYITDTKFESMDIEDEYSEVEEIFMKWSPEEIKFYYELKLQESIEQDIDDCIQKWEQHIYVELEAFVNIKDKCSEEYAEALRTKNHNQKSNSKMSKNKVKRAMKQNRVKMKHIWSSKSRKKLHLHHYLTSRKVKMKLLICKPS